MKYMVIDTESSGLMDYKRRADAPGQPRVADFAAVLLNEKGEIEDEYQRYIFPDGWSMTTQATEVNGLTTDFLRETGHMIKEVLQWYSQRILEDRAVIAFGAQFDCKMMRSELRRAGQDDLFERTPNICLMRLARPFAKFVGREIVKAGGSNKGWVKLSDLCNFLGVKQTDEHGAMVDAMSAAVCFQKMLAAGFEMTPSVHHAKDYEEIKNNV